MSAFLWSCKARPAADNLLSAFLRMVLNTSLCAFSQSYRIRSAYCMCSLALTTIENLHRKLATGRGVYRWVISNMEYWESLWSDLQSRQPPWFMNGLPTGVHEMVFRVSVPLNVLQEPWLLSPSHSLQTHPVIQHTSVFWTEREGNGPLWQHPAQRGELRTHSQALTSPEESVRGWAGFSWHLNCAALGEGWQE